MSEKNSLGMDQKTTSWFAYVLSIVSAVIVLVSEKDDSKVRAHAWQSLVMGCIFVIGYIILAILWAIIFAVGGYGLWVLFSVLYAIWGVAWVGLTIACILQATQDKMFEVPVIYNISRKFHN